MQPHHSLPARPPPSNYSAAPSRSANGGARNQGPAPAYASGFLPRAVAAQAPAHVSALPTMYQQASVSTPYQASAYATSSTYYDNPYSAYAGAASSSSSYPATANMNQGAAGSFDPEEEARIAEWNSAYNKDNAAGKKGLNGAAVARTESAATPDAEHGPAHEGKRKTVVREGGGKTWEDASLLEWDPMHPRLFIGNLAGEVTDESLNKAFARYPSLVKARVVRDKRSTKSKSYGFVSFSDTDDYFRAFKEMNGKYIGSHPVTIKRATSDVKAVFKKEDKHPKHGKNNKNQANRPHTNNAAPATVNPNMFIPRGVQKKSKSTGPKLLG